MRKSRPLMVAWPLVGALFFGVCCAVALFLLARWLLAP